MKKVLVMLFVLLMGLAVVPLSAFGAPFVGFDFTIPDDGALYFGVEEGSLTLKLSVCDLFAVQTSPALSFLGEHCVEYSYWDNEFQCWIDEIDIVTDYPIPTIEGIGVLWRGTIHVGTLLDMLAESPQTLSSSRFDIYGEVSFAYDYDTRQLLPTGSVGFYWEPW